MDRAELAYQLMKLGAVDFRKIGSVAPDRLIQYVASTTSNGDKTAISIKSAMTVWLRIHSKDVATSEFVVVPPIANDDLHPHHSYFDKRVHEIRCKYSVESGDNTIKGSKAINPLKGFMARKSVSDLNKPSSKLDKTSSATFSYTEDSAGDKRTFSSGGVYGFSLSGASSEAKEDVAHDKKNGMYQADHAGEPKPVWWYKIIPYTYVKSAEQRPRGKSNDIKIFQPGISAVYSWVSAQGEFAYDLQFEQGITIDEGFGSRTSVTGIRSAAPIIGGRPAAGITAVRSLAMPGLSMACTHHIVAARQGRAAHCGYLHVRSAKSV